MGGGHHGRRVCLQEPCTLYLAPGAPRPSAHPGSCRGGLTGPKGSRPEAGACRGRWPTLPTTSLPPRTVPRGGPSSWGIQPSGPQVLQRGGRVGTGADEDPRCPPPGPLHPAPQPPRYSAWPGPLDVLSPRALLPAAQMTSFSPHPTPLPPAHQNLPGPDPSPEASRPVQLPEEVTDGPQAGPGAYGWPLMTGEWGQAGWRPAGERLVTHLPLGEKQQKRAHNPCRTGCPMTWHHSPQALVPTHPELARWGPEVRTCHLHGPPLTPSTAPSEGSCPAGLRDLNPATQGTREGVT